MSATNRSGLTRSKHDFYETPEWAIDLILDELKIPNDFQGCVLDAGSGNGAISNAVAKRWPKSSVQGVELQPELAAKANARELYNAHFRIGNYLKDEHWENPNYILMNPPFSYAQEFVNKALSEIAPGGTVAALLRLGWLEGKARAEFHRAHPSDVIVMSKRPSFNGCGTDASAYAWFVWGPGRGNRWKVPAIASAA